MDDRVEMAALNEIYGEMELIAKIGKQCAEIEDVSPKVQKDLLIEMAIQPIFVASYRAEDEIVARAFCLQDFESYLSLHCEKWRGQSRMT